MALGLSLGSDSMETVRTDRSITHDRPKVTREIADFWNKTSTAWQTIWGPHIHHGYFEDRGETPVKAQEKLIEKLLAPLEISAQDKILDVGCGIGGSSLYLASKYGATVTGITLSQKQVDMAMQLAMKARLENVSFKVEDALSLTSFCDKSFSVVWSLESCEQFYDKQMFLQQAFRVLKPGGRLMLATWCSGADEYAGLQAKQYRKLCVSLQTPVHADDRLLREASATAGVCRRSGIGLVDECEGNLGSGFGKSADLFFPQDIQDVRLARIAVCKTG